MGRWTEFYFRAMVILSFLDEQGNSARITSFPWSYDEVLLWTETLTILEFAPFIIISVLVFSAIILYGKWKKKEPEKKEPEKKNVKKCPLNVDTEVKIIEPEKTDIFSPCRMESSVYFEFISGEYTKADEITSLIECSTFTEKELYFMMEFLTCKLVNFGGLRKRHDHIGDLKDLIELKGRLQKNEREFLRQTGTKLKVTRRELSQVKAHALFNEKLLQKEINRLKTEVADLKKKVQHYHEKSASEIHSRVQQAAIQMGEEHVKSMQNKMEENNLLQALLLLEAQKLHGCNMEISSLHHELELVRSSEYMNTVCRGLETDNVSLKIELEDVKHKVDAFDQNQTELQSKVKNLIDCMDSLQNGFANAKDQAEKLRDMKNKDPHLTQCKTVNGNGLQPTQQNVLPISLGIKSD